MEILKIVQKIHSDERIAYIDVLRIISAFAVIIVHVTANDWANAFHDSMWHIYNVYRASVNWCNPVFVMVSGVFFLDPCKILSIEKLYKKYILRIMLAIAFWGLFYYLPDIVYGYVCKSGTITGQTWLFIAKKIVFGVPWHHLWYLYMIIGLYMLAPLYRIFSRFASKKDFVYLLLVFVVFGSILPMIKSVLAFFHYESSIYFSVEQAATWTGYFFAGYFFSKYEISRKSKYAIYVAGLLSLIFTVLGTACFSAKNNAVTGIFCGAFSPTTVFQSFALFLLVKSIGGGFCLHKNSRQANSRNVWQDDLRNIPNSRFCASFVHICWADFALRKSCIRHSARFGSHFHRFIRPDFPFQEAPAGNAPGIRIF